MLKVKVNNREFELHEPADWDILDEGSVFHIIKEHKSYRCKLLKKEDNGKKMSISVNDNEYTIAVKDQFDVLLEQMGMSEMTVKKINNIKAPMPGLVIDVKVKPGDEVKEGQDILILEAMKMENVLKCPADVIVKSIPITKGQAVEKGQLLIEFE